MSYNINYYPDGAPSADSPSATAEEKNQKEDQDQVTKGVTEDKKNTAQIKVTRLRNS